MQNRPIACDLNAIPAEQRQQHQDLYDSVFSQYTQVTELDLGYRFHFPVELLPRIAEYITLERLCCPFFTFQVQVLPAAETLTLDLTGSEEIKAFLKQGLATEK